MGRVLALNELQDIRHIDCLYAILYNNKNDGLLTVGLLPCSLIFNALTQVGIPFPPPPLPAMQYAISKLSCVVRIMLSAMGSQRSTLEGLTYKLACALWC